MSLPTPTNLKQMSNEHRAAVNECCVVLPATHVPYCTLAYATRSRPHDSEVVSENLRTEKPLFGRSRNRQMTERPKFVEIR